MDKFNCELCDYSTKRSDNYYRHMNSKKHHKKVQLAPTEEISTDNILPKSRPTQRKVQMLTNNNKIYPQKIICKYCNAQFTRPDSLNKHLKACFSKHSIELELKNEIKCLNNKLKEYELQIQNYDSDKKHFNNEKKHYIKENDYYKQLVMEAGTLVKKSMSTLSYAMSNYENAPNIKTITLDDITKHEPDEIKLAEHILSAYKRKTLSQYLGDIIINLYKKTNPKKQSLWNTDDSRYTYILKELLGDTSNWIIDKKGVKTTKYIINPLVVHVRKLLEDYNKATDLSDLKSNKEKMDILIENSRALLDLVNDIDNKILEKEILKYISAHLRFNELKKI